MWHTSEWLEIEMGLHFTFLDAMPENVLQREMFKFEPKSTKCAMEQWQPQSTRERGQLFGFPSEIVA